MSLDAVIPPSRSVIQIVPTTESIALVARPETSSACCPHCSARSSRVHSTYLRRLADLPWHGRAVEIRLQVRRFRCVAAACPRRIFAERLPEVTLPLARRTVRLADAQRHIAFGLGGEPGSRLARRLAMPVSGDTLLRMIRAAGGEPAAPVRVLGVDDWAWRKGQRYGTILCDLERRRVVDLLPDRSADGLARWLQDHPGVEVVARDRGGAYADGAGRGAPGAEHVADRWHLLENCGQAVLDALRGRQWCLRRAAQGGRVAAAPDAEPPPMTAAERRQWEGWRRRRRTHETAMELHRRGMPIKGIARATGIARNTVRRWVRGRSPEPFRPRRSVLALHAGFLEQRWQEGCRNGAQLWRELRAQGADVGLRVVGEWATRRRLAGRGGRLASNLAGPSAREAARLLMRDDADLSRAEAAYLRRLLDLAPEIAQVRDLARRFAAMVKQRQADALEAWLEDAEDSPLAALANGLRQDLAAVRAALTSARSSGQVEGQITRLKLIKRSMYGRAKLDLLRQRVMRRA